MCKHVIVDIWSDIRWTYCVAQLPGLRLAFNKDLADRRNLFRGVDQPKYFSTPVQYSQFIKGRNRRSDSPRVPERWSEYTE